MTRINSLSQNKKARSLACFLAAAIAALGISGCDDPFGLRATTATDADTLVAYAMTGSPAFQPSGYSSSSGIVVRVTADAGFDVAFDLTAGGDVRVIPVRLIAATKPTFGGQVQTQQVGILTPTGTYDQLTKAPENGYRRDSVAVVGVGKPVVLEVQSEACQFSLASTLYSKFVVDSVNRATRQIFFRTLRNPNCGFRSFLPGVPKS